MKSILVVDDDRQMVRTLCDILRMHGWEARGLHSGEEAVEAVRRERYSAVLMDVRMAGISGVEALRGMKEARPGMPVILMTAYTGSELLAQAQREGALEVLPKPVPLPTLTRLLEDVLSNGNPVLVVDDDRDFLTTLTGIIQARGYKTLQARGLDEALAILEESSPVATVLDLRLDGVDPKEVVFAIKRLSPAVALILYSGHPALLAQTAAELPSGWVRATLRKPFPPETLIELLDDVTRG